MMRVLIVMSALALATSANAQAGYGARKPGTGYGVPAAPLPSPYSTAPSGPGRSGAYGNPPSAGGGFKPFEGFKGGSVYQSPKPAGTGARPCETSVYLNACGKGR